MLTNYLNLQILGSKAGSLFLLAQFDKTVRVTPGDISLLRGICEGFPILYPSTESVECIEEISQLKIEDIVLEFPDFAVANERNRLVIEHRTSHEIAVEAIPVPLRSESIALAEEFENISPGDRLTFQ